MSWQRVCDFSEIRENEARLFVCLGRQIAVARCGEEVFAVDNTCTHEAWSLCDGYVEGAEIVCGLHQARFCLRTGKVLMAPATDALAVYPVRVADDAVWIDPDAGTAGDED